MIVVIIIAVLVLIFGLIFVLLYKPETSENANEEANENINQEAGININDIYPDVNQPFNTNQPAINAEEMEKVSLTTIANNFAERYGTFSNQSNYDNLTNLKSLMTKYFWSITDQYIKESMAANPDISVYHGFTTKALSTQIIEFQMYSKAQFKISTQRTEATETPDNTTTFYQDIIIKFIWEDNDWKVNEAKWEDVAT